MWDLGFNFLAASSACMGKKLLIGFGPECTSCKIRGTFFFNGDDRLERLWIIVWEDKALGKPCSMGIRLCSGYSSFFSGTKIVSFPVCLLEQAASPRSDAKDKSKITVQEMSFMLVHSSGGLLAILLLSSSTMKKKNPDQYKEISACLPQNLSMTS